MKYKLVNGQFVKKVLKVDVKYVLMVLGALVLGALVYVNIGG